MEALCSHLTQKKSSFWFECSIQTQAFKPVVCLLENLSL